MHTTSKSIQITLYDALTFFTNSSYPIFPSHPENFSSQPLSFLLQDSEFKTYISTSLFQEIEFEIYKNNDNLIKILELIPTEDTLKTIKLNLTIHNSINDTHIKSFLNSVTIYIIELYICDCETESGLDEIYEYLENFITGESRPEILSVLVNYTVTNNNLIILLIKQLEFSTQNLINYIHWFLYPIASNSADIIIETTPDMLIRSISECPNKCKMCIFCFASPLKYF